MLETDVQSIEEKLLLLQKIVAGDTHAFNLVYKQTNKKIYNAVMAYVKNEHIAIELVQKVYIKLWNNRSKLKDVRSLEDYLFIIARNLTLDHFKKITIENRFLTELKLRATDPVDTTSERIEQLEYEKLLNDAVMQLPPQQRQAWLLANEQELSYTEIAAEMNISRFTVKRHLELSRKNVRNYLKLHIHGMAVLPVFFIHYFR